VARDAGGQVQEEPEQIDIALAEDFDFVPVLASATDPENGDDDHVGQRVDDVVGPGVERQELTYPREPPGATAWQAPNARAGELHALALGVNYMLPHLREISLTIWHACSHCS